MFHLFEWFHNAGINWLCSVVSLNLSWSIVVLVYLSGLKIVILCNDEVVASSHIIFKKYWVYLDNTPLIRQIELSIEGCVIQLELYVKKLRNV